MKRLIVNADDFGISQGVNQGIFQAHREGIVTSTTVMVNLPLAKEIVPAVGFYPQLGVGVHLNLTYGHPVLPATEVPSLVNERGEFRRPEVCFGQVKPEEVAAEWQTQIKLFQSWGLQISHLDSHHHVHLWPELLNIATGLAQEIGVPVRSVDEPTRQEFAEGGVRVTNNFVSNFYGDYAGIEHLKAILENLPEGVSEIMCHPAIVDEQLIAKSGYIWARNTELATLIAPEIKALVVSLGINLVSYKSLT